METKTKFKILLLVTILLIAMCLFNINMVQATDATAEQTETSTEQAETNQKVQPSESTLDLIPDTMTVSIKEIEFQKLQEENNELETAVMKILADNNVDMTNYELSIYSDNMIAQIEKKDVDIHKFHISIDKKDIEEGEYESFSKMISVKYSNTDEYNANDVNTINKIDKIKNNIYWYSYSIDEFKNCPSIDTVYEKTIKDIINAYDSDLQCIVENCYGLGWNTLTNSIGVRIYFFKDDVFYAGSNTSFYQIYEVIIPDNIKDTQDAYCDYVADWVKNNIEEINNNDNISAKKISNYFEVYAGSGEDKEYLGFVDAHKKDTTYLCDEVTMSVNENVSLSATKMEKNSSTYTEMQNNLKEKGYTNIFNAYELKLTDGKIGANGLTLNFDLGTENNGKQAIVLHKKQNGTYEEFIKTVENGRISITVTELSPFMVALKDTETTSTSDAERPLDDEPKTGVADYTIFASTIALISLGAITILKFKK